MGKFMKKTEQNKTNKPTSKTERNLTVPGVIH